MCFRGNVAGFSRGVRWNKSFVRTESTKLTSNVDKHERRKLPDGIPSFGEFILQQRQGVGNEVKEQVPQSGKSYFIETYGCQMNSSDSEIVASIMQSSGYHRVEQPENANVLMFNTCAVRENAEQKVWERLKKIKSMLDHHPDRRWRQRASVGVLGCMAERLKKKLLETDRLVDFVAGPDAYRDIPNLLNTVERGQKAMNVQLSLDETYADVAPVRYDGNGISAYISIMRGCNNMCSYCVVPFTRGRERSRTLESIVNEVKDLSAKGYREITLLGQNVNSYWDQTFSEGSGV